MSCRFSMRPSKSFLSPLCATGLTHRSPQGAHQWTPLPTGMQLGPAHAQHWQEMGGEWAPDAFPAFPCRGLSSCQPVLSTLSAASRKHLLTLPSRAGAGHGRVLHSRIGVWGNRKTEGLYRNAFISFLMISFVFWNINWTNIKNGKRVYQSSHYFYIFKNILLILHTECIIIYFPDLNGSELIVNTFKIDPLAKLIFSGELWVTTNKRK